ncbi:MAG: hypothetical protein FWF78_00610 [Defluviitaleaceae bacterium]|nr:hypothetical protein [Defluviitaleaceae bacterium]
MDKEMLKQVAMLHPDDVFPPFDIVMQRHGFEAVCTVAEQLGGFTVHIPVLRNMFAGCIAKQVNLEFKGGNYAYLSRKYGFSERHLRRMLGKP